MNNNVNYNPDAFINITLMTSDEFKNDRNDLIINYCYTDSPFGKVIIASTYKGVCYLSFYDDEETGILRLRSKFPNFIYKQTINKFQNDAIAIIQSKYQKPKEIRLHLIGTLFQIKVWQSLIKISVGSLLNYQEVAKNIGYDKSYRAVGNAIGKNPIALIIPCHRVIKSSGEIGQYAWGKDIKSAIIKWEKENL